MLHNRQRRRQPPDVQCRRIDIKPGELRFTPPTSAGQPFRFEGYAVKWATTNAHGERFAKGAFADLIASGKTIHMYYNHGYMDWFTGANARRIGKWISLTEDDTGLLVVGELTPGLTLAGDVAAMLQHGTVDGLSIAFFDPNPMDVMQDMTGTTVINRVDLYEISVVDDPSDATARITATGEAIANIDSTRSAADFLRNLGLARVDADALLARLDDVLHEPTSDLQSVLDAFPEL